MAEQSEIVDLYETLKNVLHNDNQIRTQAEAKLKQYLTVPHKLLLYLVKIMQSSEEDYIRKLSSVLFKQYIALQEVAKAWNSINPVEQEEVKKEILEALKKETNVKVSKQICQSIAELAGAIFDSKKEWPELEELVMVYMKGSDEMAEMALRILDGLFAVDASRYVKNMESLCGVLDAAFQRPSTACAVAASMAVCTLLVSVNMTNSRYFHKYTPCIIKTIELLFNEDNEDGLHDYLDELSEVIEKAPNFFRRDFPSFCETLIRVSLKKDYANEKLRQMPLEIVVIFVENIPALCKKHVAQVENLCLSLFDLAVSIDSEVESDWLKPKEGTSADEDLNPDDNVNFAASSFDKLLNCSDFNNLVAVIQKLMLLSMGSEDWRYRNAGLMMIAQVGEYCESADSIREIVPVLVTHIAHPHPKVRFAALYAIGLISDYLFPDIQKTYSKELIPPMIAAMDDKVPRVQSHACAALTNFLEHVSKGVAMEVAPVLLPKLIKVVKEGVSIAKENAVSCIASIAESAYEKFVPYYDELIPFLFACVQQFSSREYHKFRGQVIECLTIIMTSGDNKAFQKYTHPLIELMVSMHNEENPKGDPQRFYLLSSWQRVCFLLEKNFAPYLPKIIEGFFKIARTVPEMSTAKNLQSGSLESVLKEVSGKSDNGKVEINTAEIDEKEQALEMLKIFACQLKEKYAPYVEETTKIMEPVLAFSVNSRLRRQAASALPELLQCLKAAEVSREVLVEVGKRYINDLIAVHEKELSSETKTVQVMALKKIYEVLGHFMTPPDTKNLVDKILACFKSSNEQREALCHYKILEKEECEEEETNSETQTYIEIEEDYQKMLTYLLGEISKSHRDEFAPEVPLILSTVVTPYLSGNPAYQRIAIFIIDDLIDNLAVEKLGPDTYKQLAAVLIKYAVQPEHEVRQAACYGIGALGKAGGETFGAIALQCLTVLAAAAEVKMNMVDKYGFSAARDNAISSIGKILKYQEHAVPFAAIWPKWICYLPIGTDREEARFVHEFVADTLIEKPEIAVGADGGQLKEILRIFIEIHGKSLISKEGEQKVSRALKELGKYPAIAAIMNNIYEKELSPESKSVLSTMLQS